VAVPSGRVVVVATASTSSEWTYERYLHHRLHLLPVVAAIAKAAASATSSVKVTSLEAVVIRRRCLQGEAADELQVLLPLGRILEPMSCAFRLGCDQLLDRCSDVVVR